MVGTVDSATQTSDIESDEVAKLGNSSPRVVIDTCPPFESVEEAVIRFGGRGFWIPRPILGVGAAHHKYPQECDIDKLEERAVEVLKDLHMKEQEILKILKELENTKIVVGSSNFDGHVMNPDKEYLKKNPVNSVKINTTDKSKENSNSFASFNSGLIMMELEQAKHKLYENTNDLAVIRASVESLSKKMEKEKDLLQKERSKAENRVGSINPLVISRELRELNYEADQFMKTAELAKSEVSKAMSDIEKTKMGLKVIEMRWVAAMKLEEAARATKSLALAEIRALSTSQSMSLEEVQKLSKMTLKEVENRTHSEFGTSFNSHPRRDSRLLDPNEFEFVENKCKPAIRPTTSIGNILSRKLVVRDDLEVERNEEYGVRRQRVLLNRILCQRQRGSEKDSGESNSKHLFSKRKGLGFAHFSLPLSRQSKNKIQALNLW